MTRFAGVLGWPLRSTLSPVIQNVAFRSADIDCRYLAFPTPPDALEDAVRGLLSLGALGANVTMPHKEAIVPFLDELAEDAAAVGAVNTVEFSGGRAIGHNTDIGGFKDFLVEDAGVDTNGRRCLVLGAGGAARAVIRALESCGVESITVCARRPDQAEALAGLMDGKGVRVGSMEEAPGMVVDMDLIINATPLGTDGEEALPGAIFSQAHAIVDLIYSPPTTPLITNGRSAGAETWGGLGMLVRQAARSFQIWTGHHAPIEMMSAAAIRAIGSTSAGSLPIQPTGDET